MIRLRSPYVTPVIRTASVFVGYDTSADDVFKKIQQYVIDHSTSHDLSTASYHEAFNTRGGSIVDGNGDHVLTKDDLNALCHDAGVSVPDALGGCDKVVDGMLAKFDGADGSPKDNQITWAEFRIGSGLSPEPPPPPPPPPPDPNVVSDADRMNAGLTDDQITSLCASGVASVLGGAAACKAMYEKARADAQAKIARIEGPGPGGGPGGGARPPFWAPGAIASGSNTLLYAGLAGAAALIIYLVLR